MNRRDFLAAASATLVHSQLSFASTEPEEVDVELILAVDISRSIDEDEMNRQFDGYAAAFRDPALIERISGSPLGQIACMMFVWSDWSIQLKVADWRKIHDAASAEAFALDIDRFRKQSYLYTSISAAMDYAGHEFGTKFSGTRQVLDISGDGTNNSGRPLEDARRDALGKGIVINGLAVLDNVPSPLGSSPEPLDEYYKEKVIGGPGAFLVVAEGFEDFGQAVKRKIIREIASVPQPGPLVEYV